MSKECFSGFSSWSLNYSKSRHSAANKKYTRSTPCLQKNCANWFFLELWSNFHQFW